MSATTAAPRHHPTAAVWRFEQSRARARTSAPGLTASASDAKNELKGSAAAAGNAHRRNQFGFTGRYLDKETGLWYFRARYYSGSLGRFVSRDNHRWFTKGPSWGDGYVDGYSLYNGYFAPNALDSSGNALNKPECCGKCVLEWQVGANFTRIPRAVADPDNPCKFPCSCKVFWRPQPNGRKKDYLAWCTSNTPNGGPGAGFLPFPAPLPRPMPEPPPEPPAPNPRPPELGENPPYPPGVDDSPQTWERWHEYRENHDHWEQQRDDYQENQDYLNSLNQPVPQQ